MSVLSPARPEINFPSRAISTFRRFDYLGTAAIMPRRRFRSFDKTQVPLLAEAAISPS